MGRPSRSFLLGAATLLLLAYLVFWFCEAQGGVSSLDGYGIIHVAGERLHHGVFGQSRPPGHPLNEDWALPAFAWLAGQRAVVPPELYSVYQLVGGLACLGVYWLFLAQCGVPPARRLLAAACFVFSPYVLLQLGDGEEFLWATACLLAMLILIFRLQAGLVRQPMAAWLGILALAAASSGYRLEFGVVAVAIALFVLLLADLTLVRKAALGLALVLFLAVLWLPLVLSHGAHPPYEIPFPLKTRLEIGGYKIIFGLLGVVPMTLAIFFYWGWWRNFRILPPSGPGAALYWTPRIAIIFFLLFFVYPTKPAVLLPGLACLIAWGALQTSTALWSCFVLGCDAIQLVHLDCFSDRRWVGLQAQPSQWSQFQEKRPLFRAPILIRATQLAAAGPRLIIANAFPWDFVFNQERGGWTAGVPRDHFNDWTQSWRIGEGIVASREMIDRPDLLKQAADQGYAIWIDEALYREVFQRYDLPTHSVQTGMIGNVPCQLVKMNP